MLERQLGNLECELTDSVAVAVFFYGSYINRDVLAEVDIRPSELIVGRVAGYRLVVEPLANLVEDEDATTWGVVGWLTHEQLSRLYAHAEHVLGGVYLPRAVTVETESDTVPALCYISHDMDKAVASWDYVERIAGPAESYGFPGEYVQWIRGFGPR